MIRHCSKSRDRGRRRYFAANSAATALRQDRSGSISIIVAVGMVAFFGFSALAVDVGYWYMARRTSQTAADAAAVAAAFEIAAGNANGAVAAAQREAARNGYPDPTQVAVNIPPVTGPNAGAAAAVEVVITEPQPLFFASVLLDSGGITTTRAVALGSVADELCLLALDPSADDSVGITDQGKIEIENCGAATNSSSSRALYLNDSAKLEAFTVAATGGILQQGTSTIDTPGGSPESGAAPKSDPLSSLALPTYSGCGGGTNTVVNANMTLSPGVYCGGIWFKESAIVTLLPGIYIIDGGNLRLNDLAKVTGTEVTFILTSSTGSANIGSFDIRDHARLDTTAPTNGPFTDISLYQDRSAPAGGQNIIHGESSGPGPAPEFETTGIVYTPAQEIYVDLQGELETEPVTGCVKIIARKITVRDRGEIEIECDTDAVSTPLGGLVARLNQ